jgi:hypothetical protein
MATMIGYMPDEISKVIHDFIRPKKQKMSAELLEDINMFWEDKWCGGYKEAMEGWFSVYDGVDNMYDIDYGIYTNYEGEFWEDNRNIFEEDKWWDNNYDAMFMTQIDSEKWKIPIQNQKYISPKFSEMIKKGNSRYGS